MTAQTEKAKATADALPLIEAKHPNLAAALVAALASLTVVEKGRQANAGTYSYGYADLGDIVKLTRPTLALHGIVVVQMLGHYEDRPAVTTVLLHESGEEMRSDPFPFPHGKDAQATGSWVTYMRRYSLLAALGLATGEDDDGAKALPAPPPWTYADAKRRLFAAVKDDKHSDEQNKATAAAAWTALHGDDRWRDWEHGFPTGEVEAWVNQPVDDPDAGIKTMDMS